MEIIKSTFLQQNNKKVFVILCLHEDEPFLEVYSKKIQASTHNPDKVLELKKCNYVGLKIPVRSIGQQETFEFVVSIENCDVVTFSAKTWNLMIEWVNCLKLKLRELKILSPKENIYTKPPGMKPIMQSTRNPRDPLPLRPMNVSVVPGLEQAESSGLDVEEDRNDEVLAANDSELVSTQTANFLDTLNLSNDDDEDNGDPITIPIFNFSTSNTTSQNLINLLSNPLRHTANGATFTPFEDAFNDDDLDEDIDEVILPTSLQIDYIPDEEMQQQQSLPRDNITVIKIAEDECASHAHKQHDPKVTKIKIEMDYDQLFMATSSAVKIEAEPVLPKQIKVEAEAVKAIRTEIVTVSKPVKPETVATNKPIKNEAEKVTKPTKNEAAVVSKPSEAQTASTSANNPTNGTDTKIEVAPSTPRKALATPKKTPMHEKRKLSIREKQVQQLSKEIGTEIRFKLRKKDCVDAFAFVPAFNNVWIAGFKPNPLLYCLHVGDQLLAINNIVIKSPADAQKYIKMCSGLFVEITIRRLPLAGIFLIRREFESQCLGIIRDGNSPAIVEIIPNSISSHIPPRPISQDEDATWIITQINFRNLSLICHKKYDETELLLSGSGLEMSLLLQPSDFIAKIKKELKGMKNYRDYTLQ